MLDKNNFKLKCDNLVIVVYFKIDWHEKRITFVHIFKKKKTTRTKTKTNERKRVPEKRIFCRFITETDIQFSYWKFHAKGISTTLQNWYANNINNIHQQYGIVVNALNHAEHFEILHLTSDMDRVSFVSFLLWAPVMYAMHTKPLHYIIRCLCLHTNTWWWIRSSFHTYFLFFHFAYYYTRTSTLFPEIAYTYL